MSSFYVKSVVQRFFIAALFVVSITAKLPDYINKCSPGDVKCMTDNIQRIFSTKYDGDESFGFSKMDPFQIGDIRLKQDANSPVSIDLVLKKPVVTGAKELQVKRIKGFGKSPEGRHEILIEIPHLLVLSDYKIDGKVLILPVQGEGKSNLTLVQAKLKITIDGTARTEDGQTYLDMQDFKVDCIPKRLIMDFSNLFNGDKVLGDSVNSFINENWKEIYNEMRQPIFSELSKQMKDGAKKVFEKLPYSELFDI